jgi:cell division protein FtsQ
VGKPEPQSGGASARFSTPHFSSKTSAVRTALAEDEISSEDAFYRPTSKRPLSDRPNLGNVPLRERRNPQLDEDEEDEPFLRSHRRVAVRRGFLPRSRWGRIGFAAGALIFMAGLAWLGYVVRNFAAHDPRFRIDSSENIQVLGNSEVTQAELLSVFGGDMGRNVFFVPLNERRAELERLAWVETATVMRLLPDQLRVSVTERTPIAFVRTGNTIGLVDRDGVILTMDPKTMAAKHYSFPVVTGIVATDPPSARATRMKLYQRFIADLDWGPETLSSQLSEVDLSDPEDVKALVPSDGIDLLLHLGDQDFLARWRNYQRHLAEWKAQYPRLASIDLRYERQVVLDMRKDAPPNSASSSGAEPTPESVPDAAAKTGADGNVDTASTMTTAKKPTVASRKARAKAKPRGVARTSYSQPGGN